MKFSKFVMIEFDEQIQQKVLKPDILKMHQDHFFEGLNQKERTSQLIKEERTSQTIKEERLMETDRTVKVSDFEVKRTVPLHAFQESQEIVQLLTIPE